jgi:hypothetical protein
VVADRGGDGTHTRGQLLIGERPTLGSNPDELSPELGGGRLSYRRQSGATRLGEYGGGLGLGQGGEQHLAL